MPDKSANSVVFPAPFGPISPRISPSAMSKETFETAITPANRLVRPSTVSNVTKAVERDALLKGSGTPRLPAERAGGEAVGRAPPAAARLDYVARPERTTPAR